MSMESFNTAVPEESQEGMPVQESPEAYDEMIEGRVREYNEKIELYSEKVKQLEELQQEVDSGQQLKPRMEAFRARKEPVPAELTAQAIAWRDRRQEVSQIMETLGQEIVILGQEMKDLQTDPELAETNNRLQKNLEEKNKLMLEYYPRLEERARNTPKGGNPEDPEGEALYARINELTDEINKDRSALDGLTQTRGPQYKKKFEVALGQV